MEVKAPDPGARERLGHHDDGSAVTTSDIGDLRALAELVLDALEGGDPFTWKERPIPGAEEPLGPAEQARMVVTPAERTVTLERLLHLLHVDEEGPERVHAGEERRGLLVGEHERGFVA
jgi:hypothetical protein